LRVVPSVVMLSVVIQSVVMMSVVKVNVVMLSVVAPQQLNAVNCETRMNR